MLGVPLAVRIANRTSWGGRVRHRGHRGFEGSPSHTFFLYSRLRGLQIRCIMTSAQLHVCRDA